MLWLQSVMRGPVRWLIPPHTVLRHPCSLLKFPVRRYVSNPIGVTEAMESSGTSDLRISAGEDAQRVREAVEQLTSGDAWRVSSSRSGLERTFKFKTFKAAFDYMTQVAQECKTMRHHPEWSNVYNSVFIRWTTHNPEGLSSKDIEAVQRCNKIAAQFELQSLENTNLRAMADLTEEDASFGRECCAKK